MKRIRCTVNASREQMLAKISDNRFVNAGVRFPEGMGTPTAEIREHGRLLRIRCRLIGGASQDNGFLFGTAFLGTVRENGECSTLSGVIVTEPLMHLVWLAAVVYFIIACVQIGGINLVPLFLSVFMYLLFRPEYKKQQILYNYLIRAANRI